jgi:UDP-glucose 4-epimerase
VSVLVTGGTGYIGAHVVQLLLAEGTRVVVVDDVLTGRQDRIPDVPLTRLDLAADTSVAALTELMERERVESVVHFAARKQVPESVARPAWYMSQNVGGLANLLIAMERVKVSKLVFSSSAAVYGDGTAAPIIETVEARPINPYGQSKLVGEWMVAAAHRSFGLRGISLRYFNVAGTNAPDLSDRAILNLVPMVFERITRGDAPIIFGDDYPTADGTCVRDFVHVQDVAEAHLRALVNLDTQSTGHEVFNVGRGAGYSVREVIDMIAEVSGQDLVPRIESRRPGDPASVVANVDRIARTLGWRARLGLRDMIASAWEAWVLERNQTD